MTANVTIQVATVRDTLRVPNAALRFRPETAPGQQGQKTAAAGQAGQQQAQGQGAGSPGQTPGGRGRRGGGMAGQGSFGEAAGGPGGASAGGGRSRRQQGQTVYVLSPATADKKPELREVRIVTGI